MKNTFRYLFIFACSLATVASCATFEEQEDAPVAEPKVKMTFTAEIEGNDDADTKTVLGGQMGDQYRKVLWEPGDSIGISHAIYYNHMDKFVNTEKEISEVATFDGSVGYSDEYFMFYPYHEELYCQWNYNIRFKLPSGQKYKNQSFDSGIMPMVAKGRRDERFQFQSLCGVLALNLTGSETIKSVSFTGRDASGNPIPVAGYFIVNMNYDSYPQITPEADPMMGSVMATVTLDCGEGVAVNPSEATPFYIVLPVGTYNEFSIVVATTDGKLMLKESKNPLTIKRANVTKTGALAYVADVAVDLSEIGHSNCYIVPEPGLYSFDADVIGNGDHGLVENANFHTTNTSIEPDSAELLWEDKTGVISGLTFDGKMISFVSTGVEGNALVAVKDKHQNIIWSWHIWSTDQPQEQVYINDRGTFTMLDRNIGATRNDRGTGEQWRESIGTYYQWGRKDPFYRYGFTSPHTQLSIEESIALPTTVAAGSNPWTFQEEWDSNFWSIRQKTIYDPCPVGYKVPPMDVWYGFSKTGENVNRTNNMNVSGSFDYGFNFIYDGSNVSWYPATGRIAYWGENEEWHDRGRLWSAENSGWSSAYLNYYYTSAIETELHIRDNWEETHYGYPIRCMKDEGHVDTSYPTVKITGVENVTSESATVVANVTDEGVSEVTERGIIWGLNEDLTVDNGTKIVADVAGGGEYLTTLSGLQNATVYYVRPYAINSRGLSYGKVSSFRTTYAGEANNLSAYGTSNCYIVEPAYCKHYINGSVKGCGYESIGSVASVEVLWETNGYGMKTDPGTVIFDVTLKDGNIYFYTNGVEGNALVASKDAMGTILWSWHIWVTDTPKEQLYNYNYWLLDRNLGAVSADHGTGEQWKLSTGFLYQRYRKDPFAGGTGFTYEHAYYSMESSVAHPMVYDEGWNYGYECWSQVEKSIYDPCPVGYRVAFDYVWNGVQVSEPVERHGAYFYFDNDPSARYWYPYRAWHTPTGIDYHGDGWMLGATTNGYHWLDSGYHFHHDIPQGQVRCMKDEGYVDMSYPIVKMNVTTDISSIAATINAEITNTGIAAVTSRGFIWGTSEDLTPENGTKVECGSGSGKFSATIDNLAHSTRYYVMAYATNERGTSYSNVTSFFTPYEGSAVNLSRNGTANCYIVPVAYSEYAFNASVKGNSDESVGNIAEAVVLWETKNDRNPIKEGDVIASVSFDGNMVHFFLPEEPVSGNAVIAVKDAMGTILWSWHIWVVDFDPVATQQTYNSGAVMMDRNLGALNMIPGDYGSWGLKYQWGRKDPFVGGLYSGWDRAFTAPSDAIRYEYYNSSTDTMENAVKNPAVVYNDARWGDATNLWSYKKTKYDPCPAGWRISDFAAWEGLDNWSLCQDYLTAYTPTSTVYFPTAGFSDGAEYIDNLNSGAYFWLTEYRRYIDMYWDRTPYMEWRDVDYLHSVRCMKDDPDKNGDNEDYTEGDDYEWND